MRRSKNYEPRILLLSGHVANLHVKTLRQMRILPFLKFKGIFIWRLELILAPDSECLLVLSVVNYGAGILIY